LAVDRRITVCRYGVDIQRVSGRMVAEMCGLPSLQPTPKFLQPYGRTLIGTLDLAVDRRIMAIGAIPLWCKHAVSGGI